MLEKPVSFSSTVGLATGPAKEICTSTVTNDDCSRVTCDGKFLARDMRRFRIKGVTYGPFAPDDIGEQFGSPQQVAADLSQMAAAGINAIRTYHVPQRWLLDLAQEQQISVLVDIPWSKHLCFLGDARLQKEARAAVRS